MPFQDQKNILLISDDALISKRIGNILKGKIQAAVFPDVINYLRSEKTMSFPSIVIAGKIPEEEKKIFEELLKIISRKGYDTRVIILADPGDINFILSISNTATFKYVKLPIKEKELKQLFKHSQDEFKVHGHDTSIHSNHFIGQSFQMKQIFKQLEKAAQTEIPVLLLGETGTGKDMAAKYIHEHSLRKKGTFLPVNLCAVPQDLVPSELFGHEKGAFTGANTQHPGAFEQCSKGTVFLDEIDTVDEKVQVSLLRLLEHQKFRRIGGSRHIKSNARIIAASNADLRHLVQTGRFREDLFYRLDIFNIEMPPLRDHPRDIPLLISHFLSRFNKQFDKKIEGVTPDTLELLNRFNWPGNVRELKNVIQRAVLVCQENVLTPEFLPPRFLDTKPRQNFLSFEVGTPLFEIEKSMIHHALNAVNNNRTEAAGLLGISRRAIYNKIKKYSIA